MKQIYMIRKCTSCRAVIAAKTADEALYRGLCEKCAEKIPPPPTVHIQWLEVLNDTKITADGKEVAKGDTVMEFDPSEIKKAIIPKHHNIHPDPLLKIL